MVNVYHVFFAKFGGVKFENVAGIDEAKEELMEIVDFLKAQRGSQWFDFQPQGTC